LGTGCAAPSAYRGSSGYVLLFPDSVFVFEVGEGFVTQFHRYSSYTLATIRVIWISHFHLDHYGGLVPLLSAIQNNVNKVSYNGTDGTKKQRLEQPPLVFAPNNVLRFLNLSFGKDAGIYFRGISLQAQQRPDIMRCNFPNHVLDFESVRVDHCANAFGFVLVLDRSNPFIFCFSGDTRPCKRLVDAVNRVKRKYGKPFIDLLLHEATFHESESEMSDLKKHSTVPQALQIAKEVNSRHTILTHFSHRYDMPPETTMMFTPAFDGLQLSLSNYDD
jgi:ribonuclease Z